ncbi:MAG: hypothetical protein ACK5GU_02690 [Chloroflexota bacterium]|jgi:hypothetical protein
MTIFHLFQKLDRTMRNRPDAHRWRVTMTEFEVEIFRRPVLTSEVTLGALGIGNAPMPVPICVCKAVTIADKPDHVEVFDAQLNPIAYTGIHAAVPVILQLVEMYTIIDEQ